ncbi:MAG: response regulator [Thermodesulfobacteriota bacterium]|nr:response regulator [Thermodesulfobacteriota bacterium]
MIKTHMPYGEPILVVDDEPSVATVIAGAISVEGYIPVVCTHPHEALSLYDKKSFALAFIDINLPEMTGLELAASLKRRDPQQEVVFITGHGTLDSAVEAIKIGANDYLRKPISINQIRLCLRHFQERKILRKRIGLVESRHLHLVQNVPSIIYVLRNDFRLEFINRACLTILGYSPEEALSIPNWFMERIHHKDRERVLELFRSAFSYGGSSFSAECRLIHRSGYIIHSIVKSIAHGVDEEGHEKEHLEGIIVDITDRVLLEKAMVQKEKIKTIIDISAEVAHEIRNPLIPIGGFARRLHRKFPELREGDIILREAKRLEEVLNRITQYLKQVEINCQESSVNGMVNDCIRLLSDEINHNGITCRLDLDSSLGTLYIDEAILTHVFNGIIQNAVKEMEKGETLTIKSFASDQYLHIDFMIDAPGREVKDPELFFLPFDEGNHRLGLPLRYRLVREIGALLSFAQEEDRVHFTVSFPKNAQDDLAEQKKGLCH